MEEAISLANKFKDAGHYDLFRGQLNAEWRPTSTYQRKIGNNAAAKKTHEQRIARIVAWAQTIPELSYLANEVSRVDELFAILQHYGIPTCYIDFTTNPSVAGFFASDRTTPPPSNEKCAIYCLKIEHIKEHYAKLRLQNTELAAELIIIDAPILWRLQAQHGCFLYVNHDWTQLYEMDRIEFPWSGYPAYPSIDQIYPKHKNALENLLDQYFAEERSREAYEAFLAMMADLENKGTKIPFVTHLKSGPYDSDAFTDSLKILPSWSSEKKNEWTTLPSEDFYTTVGRRLPFTLRQGSGAPSAKHQIIEAVYNTLRAQPTLRQYAIDWSFTNLPEELEPENLSRCIRIAWNGMRRLPFTNPEIADAFGALVELCAKPGCQSIFGNEISDAFLEWLPDCLEVEFCPANGASSRGFCSSSGLLSALDDEFITKLREQSTALSASGLLSVSYDPRLTFNFSKFSTIFARELIPSQIASSRELILFNPMQLTTFGLP